MNDQRHVQIQMADGTTQWVIIPEPGDQRGQSRDLRNLSPSARAAAARARVAADRKLGVDTPRYIRDLARGS